MHACIESQLVGVCVTVSHDVVMKVGMCGWMHLWHQLAIASNLSC